MKLTDCYFEKKDWRACQKEVFSYSLVVKYFPLLTIQHRCRYSKNVGNVTAISSGQKRKIHKDRDTIVMESSQKNVLPHYENQGIIVERNWTKSKILDVSVMAIYILLRISYLQVWVLSLARPTPTKFSEGSPMFIVGVVH